MGQMTPEVSKLLERALSLSVEEQEALDDSLISNLGGKVDEGVQAAWEAEIGKRIAELDSGKAKTTPWGEVRMRNLAKLPRAHYCCGGSSGRYRRICRRICLVLGAQPRCFSQVRFRRANRTRWLLA